MPRNAFDSSPLDDEPDQTDPTLQFTPLPPLHTVSRAERQQLLSERRRRLSDLQHQRHTLIRQLCHEIQDSEGGWFGGRAEPRTLGHQLSIDIEILHRFRDRLFRLREVAERLVEEVDAYEDAQF